MTRPTLSINLAISADGKTTSTRHLASTWTSAQDHQRLLALREKADAILVGHGTLKKDRMTLTCRSGKQPLRCIITRHAEIDPAHPVFHTPGGPIHVLATDEPRPPDPLPENTTLHHGDIPSFLKSLWPDPASRHIHCEGGGSLIHHLAELDLIDIIHLTFAGHTLFGGAAAPTLTGLPGSPFPFSLPYEMTEILPDASTGECFLSYRRKR